MHQPPVDHCLVEPRPGVSNVWSDISVEALLQSELKY